MDSRETGSHHFTCSPHLPTHSGCIGAEQGRVLGVGRKGGGGEVMGLLHVGSEQGRVFPPRGLGER